MLYFGTTGSEVSLQVRELILGTPTASVLARRAAVSRRRQIRGCHDAAAGFHRPVFGQTSYTLDPASAGPSVVPITFPKPC